MRILKIRRSVRGARCQLSEPHQRTKFLHPKFSLLDLPIPARFQVLQLGLQLQERRISPVQCLPSSHCLLFLREAQLVSCQTWSRRQRSAGEPQLHGKLQKLLQLEELGVGKGRRLLHRRLRLAEGELSAILAMVATPPLLGSLSLLQRKQLLHRRKQ